MKNLIKIIAVLLNVVLIMSASACSLLFGDDDEERYVDVQIQHSESTETITIDTKYSTSSSTKVTPEYIEDKILLGYYDTQDDSGSMYFDFLGKFALDQWRLSYPTKLYAVYEDLDSSKTYKSSIKRDENPYSEGYSYWDWLDWEYLGYSAESINYAKNNQEYTHDYAELAKFIYSNGNKKIRLTFHFTAKQICNDCEIKLNHKIKVGDEYFNEERSALSQSWKTFSSSIEIYAKQLKGSANKKNYIHLQMNPYGNPHLADLYTIKNIYYTVNVVE